MLSFLLGGGEIKEFTSAEAAEWFAETYLPDLRQFSVKFPEEKTVGIDGKDWEFIPIGAFPNADNQKKVLYH